MGRIQGLQESGLLTENQLLKSGEGYVFSITISFAAGTAGQKVILRDGTDGTGKPLVVFVCTAAQCNIAKEWPQGKKFETGLYYDEGAGEAETELTFK